MNRKSNFLAIDASNIRAGGGISHLINVLNNLSEEQIFDKIFVFGTKKNLKQINTNPLLEKVYHPFLDGNFLKRFFWQQILFPVELKKKKCRMLFLPSPSFFFRKTPPIVTMFRNMLPFNNEQKKKYGFTLKRLRLELLKHLHILSFKNAKGLILLNEYAKNIIKKHISKLPKNKVIAHGISKNFFSHLKKHREKFSKENPFKFLYVSHFAPYKNHTNLICAVKILIDEGYQIQLDIIGKISFKKSFIGFKKLLKKYNFDKNIINYIGEVSYENMPKYYQKTDAFVFVSSCENMPNTLLEAMAASLPIVCLKQKPMTDILGDATQYCADSSPVAIAKSLKKIMLDANLRKGVAFSAYQKAKQFSWTKCSEKTFEFIMLIQKKEKK